MKNKIFFIPTVKEIQTMILNQDCKFAFERVVKPDTVFVYLKHKYNDLESVSDNMSIYDIKKSIEVYFKAKQIPVDVLGPFESMDKLTKSLNTWDDPCYIIHSVGNNPQIFSYELPETFNMIFIVYDGNKYTENDFREYPENGYFPNLKLNIHGLRSELLATLDDEIRVAVEKFQMLVSFGFTKIFLIGGNSFFTEYLLRKFPRERMYSINNFDGLPLDRLCELISDSTYRIFIISDPSKIPQQLRLEIMKSSIFLNSAGEFTGVLNKLTNFINHKFGDELISIDPGVNAELSSINNSMDLIDIIASIMIDKLLVGSQNILITPADIIRKIGTAV